MRVSFQQVITSPWTELSPVLVGKIPPGLCTPEVFVLVEGADTTRIRIDVYADSCEELTCFQEAILWHNWVAVGYGNKLHLVPLDQGQPITTRFDTYFGYLYPTDDLLLVATAKNLHGFNPDGTKKWSSPLLGIDGVVIRHIEQDVIYGEGEWDPPDGWEPFRVDLHTGRILK
jgi:hypothetical protein